MQRRSSSLRLNSSPITIAATGGILGAPIQPGARGSAGPSCRAAMASHDGGQAAFTGLHDGGPCQVAHGFVGIGQGLHRALGRAEIERRHVVALVPFRRDAEDAAAVEIAHRVAADAGIVPVGDEQRAIRSDADVARGGTTCRACRREC